MLSREWVGTFAWFGNEQEQIKATPSRSELLRFKARHTTGDSELLAYRVAINRFRAKPDLLLIRQIVERLDDRTSGMGRLLETLMDERMGTSYLNLFKHIAGKLRRKWEASGFCVERYITARRRLKNSRGRFLSHAKARGREGKTVFLLRAFAASREISSL